IVHNGIIENYRELRKMLAADGHRFRSQTDTEVIAHLIERYQGDGPVAAVLRAARDLQGSFAIACVAADAPRTLVVFGRGSTALACRYSYEPAGWVSTVLRTAVFCALSCTIMPSSRSPLEDFTVPFGPPSATLVDCARAGAPVTTAMANASTATRVTTRQARV